MIETYIEWLAPFVVGLVMGVVATILVIFTPPSEKLNKLDIAMLVTTGLIIVLMIYVFLGPLQ